MPDRNLSHPMAKGAVIPRKRRLVRRPKQKRFKLRQFIAAGLLGVGLAYWHFSLPIKSPQAALVLGGEPRREQFAAEFARQHPNLPIWVSGGSNPEYAEWVFQQAGVSESLVHLDYSAVDTLTNFTTLADKLRSQGITSIYLITSDYHMRRAEWIGQVVLGSRGIQFQAVAIPTHKTREPLEKAIFDGARAVLWVITGNTGKFLKQEFNQSS
jgi:uncharacterized SAM-binding protein YcdF (DUF218 family)